MYEPKRHGTNQAVAYTGTAGLSAAFGSQTRRIRVAANSACHVKVDTAPTATIADPFLPANWIEEIGVNPGEKISVIRASTDGLVTATSGTLLVTELT